MIKIDKSEFEVNGSFDVVVSELMTLNIEIAKMIAKNKLKDSSNQDDDVEELESTAISFLNTLQTSCIDFIEHYYKEYYNKEKE